VTDDAARRQWAAVAERYGADWAQAGAPDLGWLVAALHPTPADRSTSGSPALGDSAPSRAGPGA